MACDVCGRLAAVVIVHTHRVGRRVVERVECVACHRTTEALNRA